MSEIINAVVPIDAIQVHPRNYNVHPQFQIDGLKKSLNRFQQYRSVVLWQQSDGSYMQVAGHGVVEAMKQRGATEVRADILPEDTDPLDIEGILAADNQFPLLSTTNEELLAAILQEQADAGIDLATMGTDEESLRQMLESLGDEIIEGGTNDEIPGINAPDLPYKNQFAVAVICGSEDEQKKVYDALVGQGYTCKVLVV